MQCLSSVMEALTAEVLSHDADCATMGLFKAIRCLQATRLYRHFNIYPAFEESPPARAVLLSLCQEGHDDFQIKTHPVN